MSLFGEQLETRLENDRKAVARNEQLLGADTAIISHAKELLTDSKRGYSVFNPTLCRSGLAKKDDEYCYVPSMPQAGYGECAPVRENAIKTEGRTLESAFYKAVFDENGYLAP